MNIKTIERTVYEDLCHHFREDRVKETEVFWLSHFEILKQRMAASMEDQKQKTLERKITLEFGGWLMEHYKYVLELIDKDFLEKNSNTEIGKKAYDLREILKYVKENK